MNIPDNELNVIEAIAAAICGAFIWMYNRVEHNSVNTNKDIEVLKLCVQEVKIKRQSDVDVMTKLSDNIESLSKMIVELRVEMQNKQSK